MPLLHDVEALARVPSSSAPQFFTFLVEHHNDGAAVLLKTGIDRLGGLGFPYTTKLFTP